jgi:hypothetical protein
VIAEAQLDIWASQGPTAQFTDTYNRIRGNLLDKGAPYPLADTEVFLQGSYKNDTNVYGDSDVDIVLCHTGAFFKDLSRLSPADRAAYDAATGGTVQYGYNDFKRDATAYITRLYNIANADHRVPHVLEDAEKRRSISRGATQGAGTRTCSSRFSSRATTSSSPGRTSATTKGCASFPWAAR